ncbi:MAG: hypothetical protein WBH08_08480 [Methanothrix sp.]
MNEPRVSDIPGIFFVVRIKRAERSDQSVHHIFAVAAALSRP